MTFPSYRPISADFHTIAGGMGFADYSVTQRLIRGPFFRPIGWRYVFKGKLLDGTDIVIEEPCEALLVRSLLNKLHEVRGYLWANAAGGPSA